MTKQIVPICDNSIPGNIYEFGESITEANIHICTERINSLQSQCEILEAEIEDANIRINSLEYELLTVIKSFNELISNFSRSLNSILIEKV